MRGGIGMLAGHQFGFRPVGPDVGTFGQNQRRPRSNAAVHPRMIGVGEDHELRPLGLLPAATIFSTGRRQHGCRNISGLYPQYFQRIAGDQAVKAKLTR